MQYFSWRCKGLGILAQRPSHSCLMKNRKVFQREKKKTLPTEGKQGSASPTFPTLHPTLRHSGALLIPLASAKVHRILNSTRTQDGQGCHQGEAKPAAGSPEPPPPGFGEQDMWLCCTVCLRHKPTYPAQTASACDSSPRWDEPEQHNTNADAMP